MTRIYRHVMAGVTWIERGTGTPLIVVSDHGNEVAHSWTIPELGTLVYDDDLHETERETIDAAVLSEQIRIRDQVAASTIPAVAKSTVRKIIEGEGP